MEHRQEEREAIFSKGMVGRFLYKTERLAKPLLQAFSHDSVLPSIYERDVEPLRGMLRRIRAALVDSDKLEFRDVESSNLWLSELRDLECSAEDIIEELEFHAFRKQKIMEFKSERSINSSKRKRDEEEFGIFSSSPAATSLGQKIEKLRELHQEIAFDREALRLRDEDGERRQHCCSLRPPTSSLMHGAFHGRGEDMEEVIRLLTSNEGCAHGVSVILIYGMGGVGKTSLAQHVFNDRSVISHFDFTVWVCVSEGLDVLKVTKAIRESLIMETPCPSELDSVQRDVMSRLEGKRFLLVLDDLWNFKHWENHWSRILDPLRVSAEGSKIIVTTRNSRVAKYMGTVTCHHLSCLSDDECLQVFQQHAYGCQDPSTHPDLITIGKQINQKCNGLPLAAKVLGCFLQTALNEEHWSRVLEGLWSSEECENGIGLRLRLSYDHLPLHLKRCFLYCSLFPKGYSFMKDQLARLWAAEGFLASHGGLKLRETSNGNFEELVDRSFFQQSLSYDTSKQSYKMHDLFHELAQSIAGSEYARKEDGVPFKVQNKTRHSSLILHECHLEKGMQFELIDEVDLRTLLLIRRYEHSKEFFHVEIPNFRLLQCLRVLDLSHTDIENLPASIGTLIHLRYLGLRNTKITRLPESICGLFKLQTLDLEQCRYLQELPQGISLLSDLQHLGLPPQCSKIHIPSGIERLTNLQSLSAVTKRDEPECSRTGILTDMVKSF